MNHCRDCNSDYTTPGTCNCFAPGGKRSAAPAYVPYTPWTYVPYPYTPYPWTITTTPPTGTTITYATGDGAYVSNNTLRVQDVHAPMSYTIAKS
jgi:hypothetical protein